MALGQALVTLAALHFLFFGDDFGVFASTIVFSQSLRLCS